VKEAVPGKERLRLQLKKLVPTVAQAQFGDPVTGTTRFDVCFYDAARRLAGALPVDRGGATCGGAGTPCWKALGTTGYRYRDGAASADGVLAIVAKGGPKRSRITVTARNQPSKEWVSLPTGLAPALQGASAVTVQVTTSDGACVGGTMSGVKRADAGVFKAAGPLD
jgi:hypothetical protein